MGINLDKPDNWEIDIALSVAMYNEWYKKTAPEVYRNTRETTVSRLGYEAAEGIDWIWEHRMSDLDLLGI